MVSIVTAINHILTAGTNKNQDYTFGRTVSPMLVFDQSFIWLHLSDCKSIHRLEQDAPFSSQGEKNRLTVS